MKYFLVLYVIYTNDEADKKSIYELDSPDIAVANVYKYMGQYMCAENIQSILCMAFNSNGGLYKSEQWNRSIDSFNEE